MTKCIIMPIGFDTSGVLRALSDHQLQTGDKFVFFFPATESERSIATRKEIERMIATLTLRGIRIEQETILADENDFTRLIEQIFETIINLRSHEVIIEISGGLRVMCAALVLAAFLLPEYITGVFVTTETKSRRLSLPSMRLLPKLTHSEKSILEKVAGGASSMRELTKALTKDESTLNRQVGKLVEAGLISKERGKKPMKYSLTPIGKLFFKRLEIA